MAHVGAAFRDASPRADSAFYSSADPRPYITSACCTSRQRYEGQQTPWEQLACPALLRTVRYLRYGGPSRRRPIAYTQNMQSVVPPARGHDTIATTAGGSTARPSPRPPRRRRHPSHFPQATTTTATGSVAIGWRNGQMQCRSNFTFRESSRGTITSSTRGLPTY